MEQDTLHTAQPAATDVAEEQQTAEENASVVASAPLRTKKLTPYQVLRQLPPDATPAQQDSAIQANFHAENTHLSERPDTLHLPGHDRGRSYKDEVSVPLYYKEHFFANDSLLRQEVEAGRYGVAGDPKPYSIGSDDVISALLIACFVFSLIAISRSLSFIARQAKDFFFVRHSENTTALTETTSELRIQILFVLQTCLMLALITFFYTLELVGSMFFLKAQYHLVAIFTGCFIGYYLLKALLYEIVNSVFFNKKQNEQWFKSQLFITAMSGIVLLPVVLLQCYFHLSLQTALICVAVLLILVKISAFYKCFVIFFRQYSLSLQIILYFCTLEVVPLLSLAGVLVMIVDYLKINF